MKTREAQVSHFLCDIYECFVLSKYNLLYIFSEIFINFTLYCFIAGFQILSCPTIEKKSLFCFKLKNFLFTVSWLNTYYYYI